MPIDTQTPGSPGWWFSKLLKDLGDKQDRLNRLDAYYRGDCDLPEGAAGVRDAYRAFQRRSRTNFAELVVEAVRERMMPVGFRTGAAGDELGDKEAWRIWQANSLDADSAMVDRAALSMSESYVIVGPPDREIEAPLITPEDPRQVIAAFDPRRRRRAVASLKVFTDDVDGSDQAYLYLPDPNGALVYRARRARSGQGDPTVSFDPSGWEPLGSPQKLSVPFVPVVRFAYRPQLDGATLGEFEDVMDVLDRINFMLLQRLVITASQAFKQRAIKGDLPEADAQGNPIDYNGIFRADPGALWQLPDGTDLWESQQTDITPLLTGVRHDIQDLAAVTRTPLFYLTPDSANGSAEGASLAREGLVFKTQDRIAQATESWEQVMSYAFAFAGDDQRAKRADMEVLWAPPERYSLAERFDAASKAVPAGVPWETVMSDVLQFSPQKVERMAGQRAADALLAPAPVVPPAEVQPVP